MAKTLATKVDLNLLAQYVDSADLNAQRGVLSLALSDDLATGTAANQANLVWYDTRTLAATSEQLDLAGVQRDAFADVATFTKIKTLLIRNKQTTTGLTLTIGGGTTNPISTIFGATATNSTETIGPDGWCVKHNPVDGFAVAAGSADTLKLDAGTNTVVFDILVIGIGTTA